VKDFWPPLATLVGLHRDGKKVTRQFFGLESRFSTTDCTRPVTLMPPTNVSVMVVPVAGPHASVSLVFVFRVARCDHLKSRSFALSPGSPPRY
jgi:hypothetical protein